MIRNIKMTDAHDIMEIYNYYITFTHVTFEERPLTLTEMENRISDIKVDFPWIVYIDNERILGYAYANKWRTRSAYRYSVESTVYLRHDAIGKGIGSVLYGHLLNTLRETGYHAVIGSLALPNDESVRLHEKFGYKQTAHLKEVGKKFGKWIDVGYWELILAKKVDQPA